MEMLANYKIREAMAAGEFDNLPGHGKPLDMDKLGEDVATKIMRNSGYKPAWADKKKKLDSERGAVISTLRSCMQEIEARAGACAAPMSLELVRTNSNWQLKAPEIEEAIKAYNKKVTDYNLAMPAQLHMHMLSLEAAFARL